MRPRSVWSVSILALALAGAWPASASADVIVGAISPGGGQGRIGPIRGHYLDLGRTTVREVRRAEGRKPNADQGVMGLMGPAGRVLTYRIREGKNRFCRREYSFPENGPRRLEDFSSNCRATRTPRGTQVGTNALKAESLEGVPSQYSPPLGHDCSFADVGIAIPGYGPIWLVLWMDSQNPTAGKTAKVRSIDLYGPDAVTFAAACSI